MRRCLRKKNTNDDQVTLNVIDHNKARLISPIERPNEGSSYIYWVFTVALYTLTPSTLIPNTRESVLPPPIN